MTNQVSLFDLLGQNEGLKTEEVEREKREETLLEKYCKKYGVSIPTERDLINTLSVKINTYDKAYYTYHNDAEQCMKWLNVTPISNGEWDYLYDTLVALEQSTGYVREDSPTKRVGADAVVEFAKHNHRVLQLSSDKFHHGDWAGLKKFIDDVKAVDPNATFTIEYKFDGLTIVVTFINGKLEVVVTRGDGKSGDIVTPNAKTIKSVPLTIPDNNVEVEITGECVMPIDGFNAYNDRLIAEGKKPLSNPRNGASGSLKQLDPKETAKRPLDIYFYNVSDIIGKDFTTHVESLEWLKSQGLKVTDYWVFSEFEEIKQFIEDFQDKRNSLNFDVDGLVIKVNELSTRAMLGATSKFPKWMMAYKFPPREGVTQIKDVTLQVGKTGIVSVTAVVDKINLGVSIENVTLNNFEDVKKKDIRIGDWVTVIRSGDVIPKIIAVHHDRRNGTEVEIVPPAVCPVCGSPVHKGTMADGEEETVAVYCSNSACPAQLKRRIEYFCAKDCMSIEIGRGLSEVLVDSELVHNVADIYTLTKEQLLTLEGFKDKKAQNILNSIEKSKERPFHAVLTSLNINMVGRTMGELLADKFLSIDAIKEASFETLNAVEGVGSGTATSIIEFFQDQHNVEIVERLRSYGLNMSQEAKVLSTNANVVGKKFVITGTLSKPRGYFEQKIKDAGGKTSGSVSKNTDFLVVGEDAGSKLANAQAINDKAVAEGKAPVITILTEAAFDEFFQ